MTLYLNESNIVLNSKSLTDVRHIFYRDLDKPADYALIQHSLKIAYFDSKKFNEIFFSFTRETLEQLRENIDRALKKEKNLQLNYSKKGIIIIKEPEFFDD